MDLANSRVKLLIGGIICGAVAVCLAIFGNPANMAICIACFIRDTAGALKLQTAAPVQYARPEVIGMVLGSFLIAVATKEYRSTAGSSPMIRFVLGLVLMIGSLIFLGCPLRMIIRMSAGDLNAYVALIGFVLGILTGVFFLKKGFSLGRAYETTKMNGGIITALMVIILVLALFTSLLAASEEGPGSMHAPLIVALIAGLVFGAVAQKTRMCFAGSVRDVVMVKNFDLLMVVGGFFVVMLVYNLVAGKFSLSFTAPIAHSQHLWNILGMYAVGFAAVLAGGCPLRQLILAGQGSSDSAVTVIGMFVGAAICHNFGLASAAANADGPGGPALAGKVACVGAILVCFIIAVFNKRKALEAKE